MPRYGRKTKSGFCACAFTFQTQSTTAHSKRRRKRGKSEEHIFNLARSLWKNKKRPTARPSLVTTLTPILWVREIVVQEQSGRDVKLNTHQASAEVKNAKIYAFTYAHTYAACAGANLPPAFIVRFGSWFVSLFG